MAFLVTPLPVTPCFIRKEYLYDQQKGHGEFVPAVWLTAKSKRDRAWLFESYLPEYAATFDKLPISAYVWKTDIDQETLLPLDHLQLWNCPSYHCTVTIKAALKGARVKFLAKNKQWYWGSYMFTLDNCDPDAGLPIAGYAEWNQEHKSFNLLKLDNGQFALQPNNRVLFFDQSMTPKTLLFPDFKTCTHEFTCETGDKWSVGDTDTVMYDVKAEDVAEGN